MASPARVNEPAAAFRDDAAEQLAHVMAERRISPVFQPIFDFSAGRVIGHEALVRGPEGSLVHTPSELFAAAAHEGRAAELNLLCIRETVRAFTERHFEGALFLNVSPLIVMERGFNRESVERFMQQMGLAADRVVIELTEDYPALDFRLVHESLMLYRSMGFRVAIDDLGEGFASLRLWSELKPEYVKADKHFVTGIAHDPVKMQFLRAIQHIAESSGSLVIAEGIEDAADFRVVKDVGIACAQGFFLGRPSEEPSPQLTPEALRANADARVPVVPTPRLRAGTEPVAHDFIRAVDPAAPQAPLGSVLDRFSARPSLTAIPVISAAGSLDGVISRSWLDMVMASPQAGTMRARPCVDFADRAPIRVESDLDLSALTALLVESDTRRMSDGFVIQAKGRYLGMGTTRDVMRSLQSSRVLAARYTNPLTLLPGQVPINEHLERLLTRHVPFTAWFLEIDAMRGLNDSIGFERGDALIRATAECIEKACEPGVDFAGHVAGSRFVILAQSEDWRERAQRLVDDFPSLLVDHVPSDVLAREYFVVRYRDGRESVRPLPKLAVGILPVLPGVFESRHEVVAAAKHAAQMALASTRSALFVDDDRGNAYPQSVLFGPG